MRLISLAILIALSAASPTFAKPCTSLREQFAAEIPERLIRLTVPRQIKSIDSFMQIAGNGQWTVDPANNWMRDGGRTFKKYYLSPDGLKRVRFEAHGGQGADRHVNFHAHFERRTNTNEPWDSATLIVPAQAANGDGNGFLPGETVPYDFFP